MYPHCDYKKDHAKESLSLVCLTSDCPKKGVICSMCKIREHSGHTVVTMKAFLSKVDDCLKAKGTKTETNI